VRYTASRIGSAAANATEAIGLKRKRRDDGTLEPRHWRPLAVTVGVGAFALLAWSSVHVVAPGNVGIPVRMGRTGRPLRPGLHVTWPLTSVQQMSSRTQNYTMSSGGSKTSTDQAVDVLGADGGAAQVNATVLYRLAPESAVTVYKELGTNYAQALVRPSARSCIRSEFTNTDTVSASTDNWKGLETAVTECMAGKIEPHGIDLVDFQLREVRLSDELQKAVDAKVAAQQKSEQQKYELSAADQAADITRVEALATADSQQILACGGIVSTVEKNGKQVKVVTPRPVDQCSQAQLTPQYLQYTYIQALKQLVDSPNNSTIILPFDQELTPLLNVGK
jgi:regulator of protease activity HflC (stomatin/prohibitin superfamily)